MKKSPRHRQGSVFYRLFWTYCGLITLASLTVATVSYLLFSNAFHREIEQVHQRRMTYASEMIHHHIVVPAAQSMLEVCQNYNANASEYGAFSAQEQRFYTPFLRNLEMLKTQAGKSNGVQGISVFYRHDELLLSTTRGLRFMRDKSLISYEAVPWIQQLLSTDKTSHWFFYGPGSGYEQDALVYCHTYPIFSSGDSAHGVIAIEMDQALLHETLAQSVTGDHMHVYLVDESGMIINSSVPGQIGASLEDTADWEIDTTQDYQFLSRNGRILSSAAVAETSWRLVCLMEENHFYTASTHIIFVIGIICFVTLLVGYMLAYFIANRVYNPLHLLSKRATEQLRSSWHKDDYALINQAISDLSHQVGELQSAIALNAPMVRNQIFSRLLSKQPADLVEIENRLHMVHVDPSAAGWNVFLVHFCEKDARGILHENRNYITYSIIAFLDQLHDDQLFIQALDDSKMDVAVVVGSRQEPRASLEPLFSCLEDFIQNNFMLQSFFCVGEWTDSLTGLHNSYETAALARHYQWFDQEQTVFYGVSYADRDTKAQRSNSSRLTALEAAIIQRNPRQVSEHLQDIQAALSKSKHHYYVFHDSLVILMHAIFNTLQKESIPLPQEVQHRLLAYQSNFADMMQYFAFLESTLVRHLQQTAPEGQRSAQVIGKVKQYIAEHLAEDLSLDLVAAHVHLSPRYLSRVFKQETGVNFTAYINECRVHAGEKLLRETDLTVQQIAYQTGYRTPAYFISQFSSRFGTTPHMYRLRQFERHDDQKN